MTEPLTYALNPWLRAVDERLVSIAERVSIATPFNFASIGEEAGAMADPPPREGLAEWLQTVVAGGGVLVSDELFGRLHSALDADKVGQRLRHIRRP